MIQGIDVDPEGRCTHWGDKTDIVCFAFPCCGPWWACRDCHDAMQDHEAVPWPRDRQEALAILCGACHSRIAVRFYRDRAGDACPHCGRAWNPGCRKHADRYYEV